MENLEKNIKDKLRHSKIDIDTNELWNEVYPHIKPERRKRFFIYLFFGFTWLISLISVGWYFSKPSEGAAQNKSITDVIESQNYSKESTVSINDKKRINNTELKSEVNNLIAEESKSKLNSSQRSNNGLNVSTEPIKKNDVTQALTLINDGLIRSAPVGTSHRLDQARTLMVSNQDKEKVSRNESLFNEQNKAKSSNPYVKLVGPKVIDKAGASVSERKIFPYTLLNKAGLNLAYTMPQPVIPSSMYSEYVYDSDYTAFSVYTLGGFSTIDKVFNVVNNMPTNNLMARASSESPLESLSGELGISYMITPKFQLSAGVNFIRINERVEDSYSVTDTVLLENVIIENVISARGSEPVYGNIKAARTINTDLKAYNRYSDLALSLDLTYLVGGEFLSPYLSVGVQQSLSSKQSGFWLLDKSNLYDISKDDDSYLSNNYGLALRFGGGVSFEVSDRTSLRVGGRYTKYLNSVTNKNYELSQKYNLLGLSAGMNIKI